MTDGLHRAEGRWLDGVVEGVAFAIDGASSGRVHADAVRVFEHVLGGCAAESGTDIDGSPCTWSQDYVPAWPVELAPAPVIAMQALYGANPGNLVETDGQCLRAIDPGVEATVAGCDDSARGTWPHSDLWAPPRHDRPLASGDGLCVEEKAMVRV